MGNQPYEFVLNFSDNLPDDGKDQKIRRSRRGCFNCRKRKKKCDELRPTCSYCSHKCIQCVWPTGNEKVPVNYKIPPVNRNLLRQQIEENPSQLEKPHPSSPLRFDDIEPPTSSSISSSSSSSTFSSREPRLNHSNPSISNSIVSQGNDGQYFQFQVTTPQDLPADSQLIRHNTPATNMEPGYTWINQYQFSSFGLLFDQSLYSDRILQPSQRDKFMSAAVNGFITSLGPQYTHPLLTPTATFTPLIQNNPFLEKIAEACGASFLSWTNPDLTEVSSQKYMDAMESLFEHINNNGYTQEDEIWVAAAFQLLLLGAKVTWGGNNSISIKNMKMSYQVINRKVSRLVRLVSAASVENYQAMPKVMEVNSVTDQYVEGLINNNNNSLKMEVENAFGGFQEETNLTPFMCQFQRMFVESFVYNFSICILVTPDSEGLPNPFEVFRDMRRYLKTPLFQCDVEWMNNPVVGAAFDAYELAAKASYLIRHIDEVWVADCAQKLLEIADNQPPPILPQEVRYDPIKYMSLKDSILVSEIVMKAAKLVLMKTLNPMLDATDPMVQREIRSTVFKLKQIPPNSSVRVISSWALFVLGLACVGEETRAEIIDCLLIVGELIHGRFVYTIIDILAIAWGRESKLGTVGHTRGLDVLLDIDLLSKVFL